MMNKNICNNCGRQGHIFYQCKLPISSFGIIIFKKIDGKFKYLMLRRKDSFGYIDFIRGKYSLNNLYQIKTIIDEMSREEKKRLTNHSFYELWELMWLERSNQHKSEEISSEKKFQFLKNDIEYNLSKIIHESKTDWDDTEWEFPKGRRNINETDLDCALREFEEETGISKNEIILIENVLPFEESFIGSNNKAYKHKYFLATLSRDIQDYQLDLYQESEVSKLEWKTLDECFASIRPYNLEKQKLIRNINNILEEYRLFI
jgi:8-oxo-dGTP pyrophosphatase MutT (NUDIX family)